MKACALLMLARTSLGKRILADTDFASLHYTRRQASQRRLPPSGKFDSLLEILQI